MTFLVRDHGDDNPWEERTGDLSVGGMRWSGKTPPRGNLVEVRFQLPGYEREVVAKGEVIRVSETRTGVDFHVRFADLDVQSELAVARYLDDMMVLAGKES